MIYIQAAIMWWLENWGTISAVLMFLVIGAMVMAPMIWIMLRKSK